MELFEKIYRLRVSRGMSQGELADVLEVSRQSVSKWETGASVPELDKLVKMCELFGVTLDELVRDIKPETPPPPSPEPERPRGPLTAQMIIGIVLVGMAAVAFVTLSLLVGPLGGAIYCSPFLICGLLCLLIKRRAALCCLWALYIVIYAYLRYATGIRFWWAFLPWMYDPGLEIHAIIAVSMCLGLAGLLTATGLAIYRAYKKR